MALRRLADGNFVCEKCDERYVAEDLPEDELVCPSCGGPLVEEADEAEDPDDEDSEGDDPEGEDGKEEEE